jgi:hypothetical protein
MLKVLSSFPTVNRWILSGVLFFSGAALEHMRMDMEQYSHIYELKVPVRVTGDLGNRRYVTVNGPFVVCPPPSPDPGFDVGDVITFTAVEEQLPQGGVCYSFADANLTRWHADDAVTVSYRGIR